MLNKSITHLRELTETKQTLPQQKTILLAEDNRHVKFSTRIDGNLKIFVHSVKIAIFVHGNCYEISVLGSADGLLWF